VSYRSVHNRVFRVLGHVGARHHAVLLHDIGVLGHKRVNAAAVLVRDDQLPGFVHQRLDALGHSVRAAHCHHRA
jgi:hypothetical protein